MVIFCCFCGNSTVRTELAWEFHGVFWPWNSHAKRVRSQDTRSENSQMEGSVTASLVNAHGTGFGVGWRTRAGCRSAAATSTTRGTPIPPPPARHAHVTRLLGAAAATLPGPMGSRACLPAFLPLATPERCEALLLGPTTRRRCWHHSGPMRFHMG